MGANFELLAEETWRPFLLQRLDGLRQPPDYFLRSDVSTRLDYGHMSLTMMPNCHTALPGLNLGTRSVFEVRGGRMATGQEDWCVLSRCCIQSNDGQ